MFMTPSEEMEVQTYDHQNQNNTKKSQRLPFRTSCDPCAASKVRCTKEQHGCSRCVQNGLKCVYGRSRRKGKPPSNKTTAYPPLHSSSSQVPVSSPAPAPASPVPGPPYWVTGPSHHQPNYNYSCPWYRSSMFPMANPPNPGLGNAASNEWERDAPNSSTPSLTPHQSLSDEDTGISYLPTTGFIWPNMAGSDPTVANGGNIGSLPEPIHEEHDHSNYNEMRHMNDENGVGQEETEMRDDSEGDQHEPCIVVACRTLSSLYQFVQSDCMNGHASNDAQSRKILKPPTPEEPSTNDTVFWMTRSATETISRLLNCAGRSCAHDPPTFLVFGSVLLKILSWYEAMYQSEIGGLVLSTTPLANGLEGVGSRPHHSNDSQFGDKNSTGLSQPSENMKESTYAVPLTIPLAVDAFNMSRATETKMKAQLLLCEVQALSHVCHTLNRRVQAVVGIQGENNMYGQANVDLLRKLGELQHALTVVCTQVPSLG